MLYIQNIQEFDILKNIAFQTGTGIAIRAQPATQKHTFICRFWKKLSRSCSLWPYYNKLQPDCIFNSYVPVERYTRAPEIREHADRIAKKWNLYEKAIWQTKMTDLQWDEGTKRWNIKTNKGDLLRTRFVINCAGLLAKPKLPNGAGIEKFKGHTFHTVSALFFHHVDTILIAMNFIVKMGLQVHWWG